MKKIFTKLLTFALLMGFFNPAIANADSNSLNSLEEVVACPVLADVTFPSEINVTDNLLTFSTGIQQLSPVELMDNYGFPETDALPTWEDLDECDNLFWTYEDTAINIDDASFKILRAWTVLDWLTSSVVEEYQIIRVNLNLESQSYCLGSTTISVSPWSCNAEFLVSPTNFLLPGFNYENMAMVPDATTVFGLGAHDISVTATLGDETISCNSTLFVVDNTPPVAIAQQNIQLNLSPDCTGVLFPESIDNGSHDGDCGDVTLSIEPSSFTAADAGTTVTVYLYVEDEAGNTNYTWTEVDVLPCGSASFQCITFATVAGLDEGGVELYPEDFLTSNSTNSGDLSLTLTDDNGNVISDGFLPQGSVGSFEYTVTDNVTGETCSGVLQAPPVYDPCLTLACLSSVYTQLSEDGTITFSATDFTLNTESCTDLVVHIFDENSIEIVSGTSVVMNQSGTYLYQISNPAENLCWGNLVISDYVPCPTTLACNNNINVSMYVPSGSATQIALINSDMLLEGNTNGCDLDSYNIEINDNGIVGNFYSGIGEVEVDQPGIYTFTITNNAGQSCWGTLNIQGSGDCLGIDNVVFPPDLDLTIVGITPTNLIIELSPESLVENYGYSVEETEPTWSTIAGCNNLIHTYENLVFELGENSAKILRTWTVLDWLTGDVSSHTQIIKNNINPGLICDFLPNSAELGDCDSGHTDSDDVEWPDDLSIADYRIEPADLVTYSGVDANDAEPIIVNNASLYSVNYIDILQQLAVNSITVNRVWTVATGNINVATYTQVLEVDISDFASLVSVNTMFNRPIPEVMLSDGTQATNNQGLGFVDDADPLNPSKSDLAYNGVSIRDYVLTQQYILGLRSLDDLQVLAADINNDNMVTAVDIITISKTIIEIETAAETDWFFIDNPFTEEDNIQTKARYIGIKPGDVDDDADLGEASTIETGIMELEDVLINNGEDYSTRLQYAGQDLSLGVEIHLYYDPSLITVNDLHVENSDMLLNFNLDIPGEIHLTLSKLNSLGFLFANENLINIDFTAKSNGLLSQAISGTSPRDSYLLGLDLDMVLLEVEVVDQIQTGTKDISEHVELFKVYPNPVYDDLTLDFINGTPQDFEINLFNINGQHISTYNNKTTIDVSTLSSGMHFYRLTQDGQIYSGRFNVIK